MKSPLDWTEVPEELSADALAVWAHLGRQPEAANIAEASRYGVIRYAEAMGRAQALSRLLDTEGEMRPGRSTADAGRTVKNPAFSMWAAATAQARGWAAALGLTARASQGVEADASNPFAWPPPGSVHDSVVPIRAGLKIKDAQS